MASDQFPDILLLSLAYWDVFDKNYTTLINKFSTSAQIKRVKTPNAAIRFLKANIPKAILITDQGLKQKENKHVLEKVVSYVRSGGTVVVGFHFPSFMTPKEFEKFFESFGVTWKSGNYNRTNFQSNPSCTLPTNLLSTSLPPSYSMKALYVDKARPEEKIYVPADGARVQSSVFEPTLITDRSQAAVAGAKLGEGYLFYIGDVNGEAESDELALRFCGL